MGPVYLVVGPAAHHGWRGIRVSRMRGGVEEVELNIHIEKKLGLARGKGGELWMVRI